MAEWRAPRNQSRLGPVAYANDKAGLVPGDREWWGLLRAVQCTPALELAALLSFRQCCHAGMLVHRCPALYFSRGVGHLDV